MEQERNAIEDAARKRLGLLAVVFFALVPLGAIFLVLGSDDDPGGSDRPPQRKEPATAPNHPRDQKGPIPVEGGAPKPALSPALAAEKINTGFEDAATPRPSSFAEEDAARLARFDNNARAFDERLAIFEAEKSRVDEASSNALLESLHAPLSRLHPGIEVTVTCTAQVCIVGLSSPEPVGTMIARISPWLRQHTQAATGDPPDVEDENGMRLAFDKADVAQEF